jgi:hypothetical protein
VKQGKVKKVEEEKNNIEDILEISEDGSVEINIAEDDEEEEEEYVNPYETDHYANLAEDLDKDKLSEISSDLINKFENDKSSRKDWEDQYSKGLKMLGVISEERDDPFPGASGVHNPLMAEAATQFQARAIAEMFPPGGPVKTQIIGKVTEEREQQAQRVQEFMNYQITQLMPDYFSELDQMLFNLSLAGSAFKKVYYDTTTNQVCAKFIPAEDLVVSYSTTELDTSPRYTQIMKLTTNDVKKYMKTGFYRDIKLTNASDDNPESQIQQTLDEIDGISPGNNDQTRQVLEFHIDYNIGNDEDDLELPYIITIDRSSQQVLAIRRNWKEDDELQKKRVYFIHYKYLPGLGFYGFGLIHMIGGLQHASTGALRALLDSAAFANLNGGFKAKGARIEGGDITVSPGEWVEVEAYGDDLRKSFIPLPFKEPSPTLMQLLGILTEAGRRFSSIADAMVGDAASSAPVGSIVAQIEQGSKVFSAIHKRLHMAQGKELKLIGELNGEFLDNEYPYEIIGDEKNVRRKDFDGRVDIIPVSDPNIFSAAQRIAMAQTELQLAQSAPNIIDVKKAYQRLIRALNIPEPEELMIADMKPKRMDPVSENMSVLNGKPIEAFSDQNHTAHIAVHQQFLSDPRFGGNKQAQQAILGPMLAHLGEHLAFQYRQTMQSLGQQAGMGMELPLIDFDEEEEGLSPDIENALSQFEAQTAQMLAQTQPPSEDQVKAQQQNAKDQAEIQLKAEELNIRKARFQQGVQKDKVVQDRLEKEFKLKAAKEAIQLARENGKKKS